MPLRPMPLVIHRAISKHRAFRPISMLRRPSTAAPRADQTRYEGRKQNQNLRISPFPCPWSFVIFYPHPSAANVAKAACYPRW